MCLDNYGIRGEVREHLRQDIQVYGWVRARTKVFCLCKQSEHKI